MTCDDVSIALKMIAFIVWIQLLSDIYGLAMEKAVDVDSVLQRKLLRTGEEMEKMVQQHIKVDTTLYECVCVLF